MNSSINPAGNSWDGYVSHSTTFVQTEIFKLMNRFPGNCVQTLNGSQRTVPTHFGDPLPFPFGATMRLVFLAFREMFEELLDGLHSVFYD